MIVTKDDNATSGDVEITVVALMVVKIMLIMKVIMAMEDYAITLGGGQ